MKKKYFFKCILLLMLLGTLPKVYAQYPANSPVALSGKLKVVGTQLSSECGTPVQLKGMSTHGLQWFPTCYNGSSMDVLVNDWKISVLRLAMYNLIDPPNSGYDSDSAKFNKYIDNLVDECGKRGIYALIDWHVAATPTNSVFGNPIKDLKFAKAFWSHMSAVHGKKKHVLYEICNEPTVSMSSITQYADSIIPIIRANDPDAVIIIGTPNYSSLPQSNFPTKIVPNTMYALHFYAGASAHNTYKDNLTKALNLGIPVFVTEFGTTAADGNATVDTTNTNDWLNTYVNKNKISWCYWNYSDGGQESSALTNGSCAAQTWNSTTTSGGYVKRKIRDGSLLGTCPGNIPPPTVTMTSPVKDTSLILQPGITVPLKASVTGGSGTITKVDFITPSGLLCTATSAPFQCTWTPIAGGAYNIKARATTSDGITGLSSTITVYIGIPQAPYKGTNWPVPGKIEAEDFNVGGNNNAYYDNSAGNSGILPAGTAQYRASEDVDIEAPAGASNGYALGYNTKGEWLNYYIDVAKSGVYSVSVNIASKFDANSMHFEIDGTNISGPITIGNTGSWTVFSDVTTQNVHLTAGVQNLKMMFDTENINIDFFSFALVTPEGLFSSDKDYVSIESLFPNPSNGAFNLKVNESIRSLSVTNIYGEVVETRSNINEGQTIQVGATLEAGTYILNLQTTQGKLGMFKLLKTK